MHTRWKVTTNDRTSPQAQGKYCKAYCRGDTVEANKGTLGIMTFKTEIQARKWASRCVPRPKILKVRPIGRGKVPAVLAHRDFFSLFYKHRRKLATKKMAEVLRFKREKGNIDYEINGKNIILWIVPPGTICYPAVEVLE